MSAQTKRPGDRLAFPAPYEPYGLTKRELFAAMAMQGMCANGEYWLATGEQIARYSLEVADALLAALAKDGAP
ncbi:MAG TPA: hypothetical protein VMA55_02730 [Acidovorax sp.]|nr:hypothetical protein [Acidovorax sp.]